MLREVAIAKSRHHVDVQNGQQPFRPAQMPQQATHDRIEMGPINEPETVNHAANVGMRTGSVIWWIGPVNGHQARGGNAPRLVSAVAIDVTGHPLGRFDAEQRLDCLPHLIE
jgi:hypothetical protein